MDLLFSWQLIMMWLMLWACISFARYLLCRPHKPTLSAEHRARAVGAERETPPPPPPPPRGGLHLWCSNCDKLVPEADMGWENNQYLCKVCREPEKVIAPVTDGNIPVNDTSGLPSWHMTLQLPKQPPHPPRELPLQANTADVFCDKTAGKRAARLTETQLRYPAIDAQNPLTHHIDHDRYGHLCAACVWLEGEISKRTEPYLIQRALVAAQMRKEAELYSKRVVNYGGDTVVELGGSVVRRIDHTDDRGFAG